MKLSLKVSLIIGVLVFFLMTGAALASYVIAAGIMQHTAERSLQVQAAIAAQLIDEGIVKSELKVLYELANRASTRSMDWDAQTESLRPEISRHNYLDFGIVGPDGVARYIQDGSTSNLADRDYIIKALAGQSVISDVLISRVIGKPVVMFAAPILVNNRAAGALIGRRDGAVLTDMTKQIGMGDTGYVYMINRQGTIICHPDPDLVYEQFNPITEMDSDPALESLAAFTRRALGSVVTVGEYSFQGRDMMGASTGVPGTDWILVGTVEKDEFFSEIRVMLIRTLLFGLVSAAAAIVILLFTLRSILIKPIKQIVVAAIDLANMNFDFTLPRSRKDEIGDTQRAFHTIREKLKKTLTDINNEHLGQKNISGNLHLSIREASEGLGIITRSMDSVEGRSGAQIKSAAHTSESVEEIIRHIGSLENAVEVQASTISRSSEAIEQMVKNIAAIRSVVQRAQESTGSLSKSSEGGRKMLGNLTGELARIADQSAFLEEANAALVNIAAQTNILAMNAAIEAAHAGEAGRGFAVVAGEVRSLAELSNKESASISEEIKNMRGGIDKIRQVSTETVETLGSMFREVTDMQASFNSVSTAVEAQVASGAQVLDALTGLRDTTEQVRTGSDKIQKESDSIYQAVEELRGTSKNMNDSVLEVQKASRDISRSLEIAQKIAEGHYLVPPDDAGRQ
jgi:methyl-accepting chemotaxis protein